RPSTATPPQGFRTFPVPVYGGTLRFDLLALNSDVERLCRCRPSVQDTTAVGTVKDHSGVLLDVATDLVAHLRRDPHVAALADAGTDLDHRHSPAPGKNAFVAGAQVGINKVGNFLAFTVFKPDFGFERRNLGLNLGGFLRDPA